MFAGRPDEPIIMECDVCRQLRELEEVMDDDVPVGGSSNENAAGSAYSVPPATMPTSASASALGGCMAEIDAGGSSDNSSTSSRLVKIQELPPTTSKVATATKYPSEVKVVDMGTATVPRTLPPGHKVVEMMRENPEVLTGDEERALEEWRRKKEKETRSLAAVYNNRCGRKQQRQQQAVSENASRGIKGKGRSRGKLLTGAKAQFGDSRTAVRSGEAGKDVLEPVQQGRHRVVKMQLQRQKQQQQQQQRQRHRLGGEHSRADLTRAFADWAEEAGENGPESFVQGLGRNACGSAPAHPGNLVMMRSAPGDGDGVGPAMMLQQQNPSSSSYFPSSERYIDPQQLILQPQQQQTQQQILQQHRNAQLGASQAHMSGEELQYALAYGQGEMHQQQDIMSKADIENGLCYPSDPRQISSSSFIADNILDKPEAEVSGFPPQKTTTAAVPAQKIITVPNLSVERRLAADRNGTDQFSLPPPSHTPGVSALTEAFAISTGAVNSPVIEVSSLGQASGFSALAGACPVAAGGGHEMTTIIPDSPLFVNGESPHSATPASGQLAAAPALATIAATATPNAATGAPDSSDTPANTVPDKTSAPAAEALVVANGMMLAPQATVEANAMALPTLPTPLESQRIQQECDSAASTAVVDAVH